MRLSVLIAISIAGAALAQEAPATQSPKDKISYALGMDLGTQLRKASVDVDPAVFEQGLKDALSGGNTIMTAEQVKATIAELQAELKKKEFAKQRKSPEENE